MKKWQIVTSVLVALIVVASLSVVAFAQGPQPPADAPQGYYGRRPMMGRGGMFGSNGAQTPQMPMTGYGVRMGVNSGSLVDVTAEVTGLSVSDVIAELQSGKTFADIAEANGKTAEDLVDAYLADRKAVLDKAVADGRLTQEAADTMLATMKTNVEQHVDSAYQPSGMGYRFNNQQPAQPQSFGPRWQTQ